MTSFNPILSTIIFVFGLQALLFSFLLLKKRTPGQTHIFLALVLFFFSLMALNIGLVNVLVGHDLLHVFRYVQLELLFGIGPSLYFYTKSILDPRYRISKKEMLHFLPVGIEFIFYRTPLYRLGADGMYQASGHAFTPIYLTEQWLGGISIFIYVCACLYLLYSYQKGSDKRMLDSVSFKALQLPIIIYSIFWIGWNILTEIDRFAFTHGLKEAYFLPSFVGLAMVTYWMGYRGYTGPALRKLKPIGPKAPVDGPRILGQVQQLKALMKEERLYLDPALNLSKLSERLEISSKELSTLLNQSFSQNFYEFVNRYRVEAFKRRLQQDGYREMTLLGLAYECGFNSKSTFNHVFKKITQQTPSQYAKALKNRSE